MSWVMSHIYDESCHTTICAESCHTYIMSHITHVWRVMSRMYYLRTYRDVTWIINVCNMTHSCVWHDSFMCVTFLIHVCNMTHSCVCHDSFKCVTWLLHVCAMIQHISWCDLTRHICVTWLITHYICVTWLIIYVWHDSAHIVVRRCDMCWDMMSNESCHTYITSHESCHT